VVSAPAAAGAAEQEGDMTDTIDRQALRELFNARRRQLSDDLQVRRARIREHGADAAVAQPFDDVDTSDLDLVLIDIGTSALRAIDRAIECLDAGTYGLCTRCQSPIGEARLRALPFAVYCRECETARERAAAEARERRRPQAAGYPDDYWVARDDR
jgi:DnaK suppressor protein